MARRSLTLPQKYPPPVLAVGDRVGWSRYFLVVTGSPTDERWRWAGAVEAILGDGDVVGVAWDHLADGEGDLWWCARGNLAKIGSAAWAD